MKDEISLVEEQEFMANSVQSTACVSGAGKQAAINRLFDKMDKMRLEEGRGADRVDALLGNISRGQLDPAVADRIFSSHNDLVAMKPPEAKQPITRMTHTELKAMKAVSATAESNPEAVIRKQCANSFNSFCSGLIRFFHDTFLAKPQQ
jgi:hypothetical protein